MFVMRVAPMFRQGLEVIQPPTQQQILIDLPNKRFDKYVDEQFTINPNITFPDSLPPNSKARIILDKIYSDTAGAVKTVVFFDNEIQLTQQIVLDGYQFEYTFPESDKEWLLNLDEADPVSCRLQCQVCDAYGEIINSTLKSISIYKNSITDSISFYAKGAEPDYKVKLTIIPIPKVIQNTTYLRDKHELWMSDNLDVYRFVQDSYSVIFDTASSNNNGEELIKNYLDTHETYKNLFNCYFDSGINAWRIRRIDNGADTRNFHFIFSTQQQFFFSVNKPSYSYSNETVNNHGYTGVGGSSDPNEYEAFEFIL